VYKGTLFENKLAIDNITKALFQAIKYASRIRERGEPLPGNLLLNDLNKETAYLFRSMDFLPQIEKIYFGAASKGNDKFSTKIKPTTINYSTPDGLMVLLGCLQKEETVPYHVDQNNILGLSRHFYKKIPNKDRFLNGPDSEIRKPIVLQDRIIPYEGAENMDFSAIMDCLNPALLQREQGAFYTPDAYVKRMQDMLHKAISDVPEGMDYLIIDRCAGVGNLEAGLSDEILSHCVLSTIEPNEYQVLRLLYGDKSKIVVPATDALWHDIIPTETDEDGKTTNDYIRERVDDPNCVIILLENPPFSEVAAGAVQSTGRKANTWKKSRVHDQMANEAKKSGISPISTNDLANLFIWSGFRHYLKKPIDSYILYAPTKYWRIQGMARKRFKDGFLCNRKHFHASSSALGCIWWRNIDDQTTTSITLDALDVDKNGALVKSAEVTLRKSRTFHSMAYDKKVVKEDETDGIFCEMNGNEFLKNGRKTTGKALYSEDIIGYMSSFSSGIDYKHTSLTRCAWSGGHGFFLRKKNFVGKIPLFAAANHPCEKWWQVDVYSKSYDLGNKYESDPEFLKKCLIWTSLSKQNKCKTFQGSDGRTYYNQMCPGFLPDNTPTQSQEWIDWFRKNGIPDNEEEKTLFSFWNDVMDEAKKTVEYDAIHAITPNPTLGLWQIWEDINVREDTGEVVKGKPVFQRKYPALNTSIFKLSNALKDYYLSHISAKLFAYELLK
jgi:hypothetical protein